MLKAQWTAVDLEFRFEAVTSRERLWKKRTYLIRVWEDARPQIAGVGEAGLFRGLSADDVPEYEEILGRLCRNPQDGAVCTMPSIRFGFETAIRDLENGGLHTLFDTPWIRGCYGIATNGLIWMGDKTTMGHRIDAKLDKGFGVLKLKIGGINFDEECDLLRYIRARYSTDSLEIRLDANGSFSHGQALERLKRLSDFGIHSIEQPIKPGDLEVMAQLCLSSPIPIALDEELIGWRSDRQIAVLLDAVIPQYIILKPSLIGGFGRADAWVEAACSRGIGWWATSALESNIGLNAIAQWVSTKNASMPQGLGTGQLYTNNIPSPMEMRGASLWYEPTGAWGKLDSLPWN